MAVGGRAGEVFTEINVTPLTDVFLVLLVIMILIAPFQTVLKVDASCRTHCFPSKEVLPKIQVDVAADGSIRVNSQLAVPSDASGVTKLIRTEQQKFGKLDIPVIVQTDGDAQQKYVVGVMDAAAGCEIKQLSLMAQRQ